MLRVNSAGRSARCYDGAMTSGGSQPHDDGTAGGPRLALLGRFATELQANLLRVRLEAAGIPVMIHGGHYNSLGVALPGHADVDLLVPEHLLDQAQAILHAPPEPIDESDMHESETDESDFDNGDETHGENDENDEHDENEAHNEHDEHEVDDVNDEREEDGATDGDDLRERERSLRLALLGFILLAFVVLAPVAVVVFGVGLRVSMTALLSPTRRIITGMLNLVGLAMGLFLSMLVVRFILESIR